MSSSRRVRWTARSQRWVERAAPHQGDWDPALVRLSNDGAFARVAGKIIIIIDFGSLTPMLS